LDKKRFPISPYRIGELLLLDEGHSFIDITEPNIITRIELGVSDRRAPGTTPATMAHTEVLDTGSTRIMGKSACEGEKERYKGGEAIQDRDRKSIAGGRTGPDERFSPTAVYASCPAGRPRGHCSVHDGGARRIDRSCYGDLW
jgi:hypothetical protein